MRRLVALCFTLFCAGSLVAQSDPKARVLVSFAIDAATIRQDLGTELPSTLTEGADLLRAELETQFPFLTWVTTGDAEHRLTATLKQRPASGDLESVVEYSGSISAGDKPTHLLFPWFAPPPVDARPLKTALRDALRTDVRASQAELKRFFASQVPVIKRVVVNGDLRRVVVPVAGINADAGSRFVVDFKDRSETAGLMKLRDVMLFGTNGLLCTVEEFDLAPVKLVAWDPSIASIMRNRARDVRVRVEEFVPRAFTNTQNGSVTTLPLPR